MEMAHIQEPGAEDNASGVGQQLEMLRATKHLIDTGALPRPRRTMTFMWGNEMTMSRLYKASHPAEYNKIVAAFSNDMVGADQTTTGAVYVLDKMPDPSARYKYQTDVLAGTTAPAPTQFLRGPDTHTLWGAGSLSWYPYGGHFLTDLYFASGKLMEQSSTGFDTRYRLKASPWEGGSDAQPFLWNTDKVGGRDRPPSDPGARHVLLHRLHVPLVHGHDEGAQRRSSAGRRSHVRRVRLLPRRRRREVGRRDHRHRQDRGRPALRLGEGQRRRPLPLGAPASLRHAGDHRRGAARGLHRAPATRARAPSARRSCSASGAPGTRRPSGRRARCSRPATAPPSTTPTRRTSWPRSLPTPPTAQANAAHLFAAFHFSGASDRHQRRRGVGDHAERHARPRREQLRRRRRHRHAVLRRRQHLAHEPSSPTPRTRPTPCPAPTARRPSTSSSRIRRATSPTR